MSILKETKKSVVATVILTLVLCGIYPLLVYLFGELFYRHLTHGSLIYQEGKVMGSSLIAQDFKDERYFHPRPSAANYNASNSMGSNLGPTSQKQIEAVLKRAEEYRATNLLFPRVKIPSDAVMASGSGLDPHISVLNALLQVPRIAKARGQPPEQIEALVHKFTQGRTLGIFGEKRVNVLLLNRALEGI